MFKYGFGLRNILTISAVVVLFAGIVAGGVLLQGNLEIRERAGGPDSVKICHATGSSDNPWQQIEVASNGVPAHLAHGDMVGDCPSNESEPEPEPPASEPPASEPPATNPPATAPPTNPPESNNGNSGTTNVTINNVTNVTNTSAPTSTPAPVGGGVVPVTTSGEAELQFRIGFEGVSGNGASKLTKVTLVQDKLVKYGFTDVTLESDENGVYSGTVDGIVPGTYDIFIKGEAHLSRRFAGIPLVRGTNNWNWGATKLIPGDFNNDNRITIEDLAMLLSVYNALEVPVDDTNSVFDINGNGTIRLRDVILVVNNFSSLEVVGDE